jgi:hypothetical protein
LTPTPSFAFRSEREAGDYCRAHPGEWQLCDEAGCNVMPVGFTPRMRTGLLAAHLWLADAHDDGGLLHGGFDSSHPASPWQ